MHNLPSTCSAMQQLSAMQTASSGTSTTCQQRKGSARCSGQSGRYTTHMGTLSPGTHQVSGLHRVRCYHTAHPARSNFPNGTLRMTHPNFLQEGKEALGGITTLSPPHPLLSSAFKVVSKQERMT